MLLFIGGAARTGKGMLVRRLLVEMHMSFLSIDVLKMGLARGVPEYGLEPDAGGIIVAEKLWPLVREMSINLLGEGVDYAMEGELLPQHLVVALDRTDEILRYPPERVRAASARKRKLPSVTTRSPGFTPSSTCTRSPTAGPRRTARSPSIWTALFGTSVRRSPAPV